MDKRLRILLISDSYPPEIRSASRLMGEFASWMKNRGHDVSVLTARPRYNLTENANIKKLGIVENENGIQVVRANSLPIHLVGKIIRGIGILSLPLIFIAMAKKYIRKRIDIVLVYSPPLPLALAGIYLAKHYGCKCILNVQDIFPQNAIDLGLMKSSIIICFFEFIENYAYSKSNYITVHSEGNLKILTENKKVPSEKVGVLYNWVETREEEQSKAKIAYIREKYGLNGKFVVFFGGVIGPAQGLDIVIDAAKYLLDSPVVFLLVGDGTEKEKLQVKARELGLDNIYFSPFVEPAEYDLILECSDVGLVTLSKDMKTPVVPGKLVSYMAKKKPIVASLNKESDGIRIIQKAGCGYTCEAENGKELAEKIKLMMASRKDLAQMGRFGWIYVRQYMSKDKILQDYEKLFFDVLSI